MVRAAQRGGVTARAGLPLVVETMRALGLDEVARHELPAPQRERGYAPEQKLEALVTLIAAGGDRVEDARVLGDDEGLSALREAPMPSPDALLDFLGTFHDEALVSERPPEKKAFVPPESAGLQGLAKVNDALVLRAASGEATVATIDHDGTIIESRRRGTTTAYEGTRGFQPLIAVWAEEQLVLADEFRDGNVAGGEDPLSSVKRALAALPPWVAERRFRADSAAYYTPLLKHLVAEGVAFAISADMSRPLRARCLALPLEAWSVLDARVHEQVDIAEVEFEPGDWPRDAHPLRYVALRFTPRQPDLYEDAGPRYHAIVSNRRDLDAAALVRWHRLKAGTIENVHRTMKDELGAATMPSARFGANAAWFRINALTYNVLTALKRLALPPRLRDARPKRLRFEIFTIPGRITWHQRQLSVDVPVGEERLAEIVAARGRLLDLLEAQAAQQ
jgi:hypothetical protein